VGYERAKTQGVGLGKDALHAIAVTLLKRGCPQRLVLIRKNTKQATTVPLREVSLRSLKSRSSFCYEVEVPDTYFPTEKCDMLGLALSLYTFTYLAGTGY